jgi:hypothetical protein
MADQSQSGSGAPEIFAEMLRLQTDATMQLLGKLIPDTKADAGQTEDETGWASVAERMQAMWFYG